MQIRKLAKNYYVAQQGVVYGYGTTHFKALRSAPRQVFDDEAEYIHKLFNTGNNSPIGNYPTGYIEF